MVEPVDPFQRCQLYRFPRFPWGPTVNQFREVCARAESDGRILAVFDSIIAAIAMEHRLILLTRTEQNSSKLPIALINPWHES
jgi:predicted nucleic acid-binding protein